MARNYLKNKFVEYEQSSEWMKLYQKLKADSDKQEQLFKLSTKVARHLDNVNKNRYRDVSTYDHCRILLKNRHGNEDYINATPVAVEAAGRKYILTQGPLSTTADDFWEMVWQEKSRAIIMLNRVIEKNAIKCHQYFPENNANKELVLDAFAITLTEEKITPHFVVRELQVRRRKVAESNGHDSGDGGSNSSISHDEDDAFESADTRLVSHYQFNTWPDFGVPQSAEDFLEFLYEVRKSGQLNCQEFGPPVVHCSAGIGRSGTFVIVDAVLVMVENGADPQSVNVLELVLELRKSRMGLIQTVEQLRFSWKAIVDAISDEKWRPLMEATCTDRSESPTTRGPRFNRGVGNQLTTGDHCVSVDESELRKRSSVDISGRQAKSARVGVSDQFGGIKKRRSTSLVGDDRSPPTKRRDEHDSEDDGEPAPIDDASTSGAAVASKNEARRRKVHDMVERMRQSEHRHLHGRHFFGLRLPTPAELGAGAAVVAAIALFYYYRF